MASSMSGSLTVRLPGEAIREIRKKARALGITPSRLVRDVIERDLGVPGQETSAFELTGKWVGSVRSPGSVRGRDAREVLGDWQPDRRG